LSISSRPITILEAVDSRRASLSLLRLPRISICPKSVVAGAGDAVCADTTPQAAINSAAAAVHRKGQGATRWGAEPKGKWEKEEMSRMR
jgi:hypothetical protein